MNYKEGLKSNIKKYYWFEVFMNLIFFYAIFQIFYLGRGLNITQIAFIGVAWTVTRMLLEVPSGILADKWGRKNVLSLSALFFMVQVLVVAFSHNFWAFLIASVLHAMAFVFMSGTNVAFFWDTLKELKREKEYERLWGKVYLYHMAPTFIGLVSAGFLFTISDSLPYFLSAIPLLIALFISFTFTEPKFHKPAEEENIFQHFNSSIKKVWNGEMILFIVVFGAMLALSFDYIYTYGQIYLKELQILPIYFGIIFGIISLVDALGSILASRIRKIASLRSLLSIFLILTLASVFGLSYITFSLGIFILIFPFFIRGIFRVLQRGYIHRKVESHNRATVDSVGSFFVAIVMIVFEPIAGKIADLYSIQTAFFVLGCVMLVYSLYYFIFKFKKKKLFEG